MARAERKITTKIADAELFERHDAFAKSYARMKKLDTRSASRGSGPKSTKLGYRSLLLLSRGAASS